MNEEGRCSDAAAFFSWRRAGVADLDGTLGRGALPTRGHPATPLRCVPED